MCTRGEVEGGVIGRETAGGGEERVEKTAKEGERKREK